MTVCAKLRQREAAYHRKMHDFHTHLGSKSAGIDTKCDTGASSTGKAYCHVPIGSYGACYHPGLAIVATAAAHQHPHSIARFWLARCALAPTIFFSRFVHMVHGMRRCAVHIARHGQHAHCAQRASGHKFCCYAQYACRKYYSQRTHSARILIKRDGQNGTHQL